MDYKDILKHESTGGGADERYVQECSALHALVHVLMSFTSPPDGIIRANEAEFPYADVSSGQVTLCFAPGPILGGIREYKRVHDIKD